MNARPQLALDIDFSSVKYPLMGFPKIDGCRGVHFTGKLTGRSLEQFANHATNAKFKDIKYSGFDGELAAGQMRSTSLCRDTTSALNTISGSPQVVWYLFDFLTSITIHYCYAVRYQKLLEYISSNKGCGVKNQFHSEVEVLPYTIIVDRKELDAFYAKCLAEGYEGAVFRNPAAMHKDGRASSLTDSFLRLKPSVDKEAKVIYLEEAKKNNNPAVFDKLGRSKRSSHEENKVGKGILGKLICIDIESGMQITVSTGVMTKEERLQFWEDRMSLIGKVIKYRSQVTGVKTRPRSARFLSIRAEADIS